MDITNISLAHVSDDQLLVRVKELVREERAATAQLLVHLAEMEERKLHCREGCSSLFSYCVEVLHLSEPAAYRRIKVARLARRFRIMLEMIADGSIHLAALDVLAAHLTDANHVAVLAEARHKTKREVEELAARLRPLPDVVAMVRKLPGPKPAQTGVVSGPVRAEARQKRAPLEIMPEPIQAGPRPIQADAVSADVPVEDGRGSGDDAPIPDLNPAHRPTVAPLSPARYRIQFTANADTYRKLRQVQELLRHRVPDGDPATIMDTALTLLLEKLLQKKTGATTRPRRRKTSGPESGEGQGKQPTTGAGEARRRRVAAGKPSESRHIPAAVKRAVWRRDEGRCAYKAKDGRRCSSRGPLEFHHIEPYVLGGRATIGNIALRCRAHNAYEAALSLGDRRDRTPERGSSRTLPGESSGVLAAGIGTGRRAEREASGGGAVP